MRSENVRHDITIVGGGLAGTCAAIAAARLGASVALVTNRPVLGGNSSSEVRVWVVGATGHGKNHFAREGGIMGELFVENQYRNIDGNPYIWDALLLDLVRAEPGISLFDALDYDRLDRVPDILARDPASLERPFAECISRAPKPEDYQTPLVRMVARGDTAAVRLLLAHGANAAIRHPDGRSVVEVARDQGNEEIAQMLERGNP